ncbi:DNA polymerase IV [Candidatus Nitronereus thalassa]|uniref:DNA polymerase IV n=1 Tax=Candidatus Nitronereus thalassa TaxID=3020898 RepID=A0ABU3KCN8_9BACT|nr:DNA polymerase IV [Candidatus Nitronereus thalassa]MDT7044224.1 DNA polymerase IV [Candidatus Nitronereus thalassa]
MAPNIPPRQHSRWIIHVDMDAFYASVEQRDYPEYRGKPVIVGADPKEGKGRGVVSAASYEARKFGIHSALPIGQAYRRCPHGVFLPVRMARYQEVSSHIFSIFHRYTDLVEPLSFDEAFLDVTGSLRLFGTPQAIGAQIQRDIWNEEHLIASVGVATTKFVAKVASDLQKPQGFVMVPAGRERAFLHDLPIERLWGAGPKTAKLLRRRGYESIGQVASASCAELSVWLGKQGMHFWELANGIDDREVVPEETAKSIGAELTFASDTSDLAVIQQTLLDLAQRVGSRLRAEGVSAKTLTLKFRTAKFHTFTRSSTLSRSTDQDATIYRIALSLLDRLPCAQESVRLLGIAGSHLGKPEDSSQLNLFSSAHEAAVPISKALDSIRSRFGDQAIQPATLLSSTDGDARKETNRQNVHPKSVDNLH